MSPRLENLSQRYVDFLMRRYRWVLLAGLLLSGLAAYSASHFQVKTDFAELLPQDEPSIKDLERAKARVGGLSNMIVAVSSDDLAANRRAIDDLAERLNRLGPQYLRFLKYHINEEKQFYDKWKHLFADLADLEQIHDRLAKKLRYERIKNNPVLNLDLDGEPIEPVEFDLSDIREKYEKKTSSYQRYVDGYFTGEDGRLWVILVYPPGSSAGVEFGKRLVARVRQAAAEVCTDRKVRLDEDMDPLIRDGCKKKYHPSMEIGFTGGIVNAIVEQEAIIQDIVLVTSICVLLNLLVIFFYFRSLRSVPIIGIALGVGTICTFGISIFIVHSLNTATAFLASIIVGNGINFGLIQLARLYEELRAGKALREALAQAIAFTIQATATAALAASISYGSLIITNFRGFNGFGYMGGLGMILCWLSAFTVQPSLIIAFERLFPVRAQKKERALKHGFFVAPLARFVTRHGLSLHVIGVLLAVGSVILAIPYLRDPFEYNFNNLRNQASRKSGPWALIRRVDPIFPRRLDPSFILADRLDQVPLIAAELERNNTIGPHMGLFTEIHSIYSFLPSNQEKKLKVLAKIRRQLSESTLSWLSDEERKDVERYRPPEDLRAMTLDDLPEAITRMYTELDGRKGLIVLLYPRDDRSVYDGKFLIELSDASRTVRLPDGEVIHSAGVGTVFADMIKAIERDGPRAVAVSFLGVIAMVALLYRSSRFVLLTISSMVFGVLWMLGATALIGEKLNFLNFIALPITFGIGIDYSVNNLTRYRIEGPGSIQRVLENTGGAVFLCSLTTIIGYSSLLIADNRALVSFGLLANIGEVTTLVAALVLMPALITIIERRKAFSKNSNVPAPPPLGTPPVV
jgi:predicted RND superfamily exporter protein